MSRGGVTALVPGTRPIATVGPIGAPQASLDIAAIPQTFRHLLAVYEVRSDQAALTDAILWAINGDAVAANYDGELLSSAGAATVTVETRAAAAAREVGNGPGATAQAAAFARGVIEIPDYTSAARLLTGIYRCSCWSTRAAGGVSFVQGMSGWAGLAAMVRLTLTPLAGANWVAGSMLSLYGLV